MELAPSHLLWTEVAGHFARMEVYHAGLWAIRENGTVWIHSGSYGRFFNGLWVGNLSINPKKKLELP